MDKFFADKNKVKYTLIALSALAAILLWCMPCINVGLVDKSYSVSELLDLSDSTSSHLGIFAVVPIIGVILSVVLLLVAFIGKRKLGIIASGAAAVIFCLVLIIVNSMISSDDIVKTIVEASKVSMGTAANTIAIIIFCAQCFIYYKSPKQIG